MNVLRDARNRVGLSYAFTYFFLPVGTMGVMLLAGSVFSAIATGGVPGQALRLISELGVYLVLASFPAGFAGYFIARSEPRWVRGELKDTISQGENLVGVLESKLAQITTMLEHIGEQSEKYEEFAHTVWQTSVERGRDEMLGTLNRKLDAMQETAARAPREMRLRNQDLFIRLPRVIEEIEELRESLQRGETPEAPRGFIEDYLRRLRAIDAVWRDGLEKCRASLEDGVEEIRRVVAEARIVLGQL